MDRLFRACLAIAFAALIIPYPSALADDFGSGRYLWEYDQEWSFWFGDSPPPEWPIVAVPQSIENAIMNLPKDVDNERLSHGYHPTQQSDIDRVVPIRHKALKRPLPGQWWSGFMAPYTAMSQKSWSRQLRAWLKSRKNILRRENRSYSRTAFTYPSADDAPLNHTPADPEQGPTNMYFFRTFELNETDPFVSYQILAKYKKGLVVYINGKEVVRARVAPDAQHGTFGFTPPSGAPWIDNVVPHSDRWTQAWNNLDPSVLKKGTNILSAVVHKDANGGQPSMYFDLKMRVYQKHDWLKKPYLTHIKKHGITISWETNSATRGRVDIYDDRGSLIHRRTTESVQSLHEMRVRNLNKDTSYHYEVHAWHDDEEENQHIVSEKRTFKTAPSDDAEFDFLFYGDSRYLTDVHSRLAERMLQDAKENDINLVLHAGDIVNQGFIWEQWQQNFFAPAEELIAQLPIVPVPGNHELNTKLYYDYFDLPGNEAWYHFRYGIADIYALNSNVDYGPQSEQYKWLQTQLATQTGRWKIVMLHHPPYSCAIGRKKEGQNLVRDIVPLLEAYGVDVVLLGHDHVYGRSANINGVHYVISGGGGSSLYNSKEDAHMIKCRKVFHYVKFEVKKDALGWTAIGDDGAIIDTYELTKK
jgi:predicted phosphodiesterase